MTLHRITTQQCGLGKAFVTALLLSGSPEMAEDALLEGMRSSDNSGISDDDLLQQVAAAAVRTEAAPFAQAGAVQLPVELHNLLHLPPDLRRCFVLRFLVALPREACARLLRLGVQQIDELACRAAAALARIEAQENAA